MGKKLRTVIRGNTVYEIDKFSKKPKHITHDVDGFFKVRNTERDDDEDSDRETPEREEPRQISPHERFKNIKNLAIGNSGKSVIIKEADGLNKDISIDETEHELKPIKYMKYDIKYRKSKKAPKIKRKIKKCRCKK